MLFSASGWLRLPLTLLLATTFVACSDSSDRNPQTPPVDPEPPEPELTYSAEIVWTEYGIPHVTASDWGSLGYGQAFALARENYCVLMREYVVANGESARYLGESGDIEIDFVWKMLNSDERIEGMLDDLPEHTRQMVEGYAAGLNRFLRDTGVDELPDGENGCRGEEWVREVDSMDVIRVLHKLVLLASGDALAEFIAAAGEPSQTVAMGAGVSAAEKALASLDGATVIAAYPWPQSR